MFLDGVRCGKKLTYVVGWSWMGYDGFRWWQMNKDGTRWCYIIAENGIYCQMVLDGIQMVLDCI